MDKFEKLPLKKLFIYSFFISLIGLLICLITQFVLPPEIPLFYGLPQTEAQIVSAIWIIIPSLGSIAITIINCLLAIKISDNYLKKTLAVTSIFVSSLAIITTIKIIFLVGSI